jgi:hypothetical protein
MLSVLLGKGDGTFQAPKNYNVGKDLQSIAMADFDGDGKLDLAVIDSGASTEAQNLAVLRGNGDGTFQMPPIHFDVKSPYQAAVGDFNKDGKTDLAVANNFGDSAVDVDVLRNTTYTGAPAAIISHLTNGGTPGAGGQWSTTILLVNAEPQPAAYQLNFHSEADGSPLALPLLTYGPQSSVTGTIAPGELAVIQTDGSGSTLLEGWAELITPNTIGGTGIFTNLSVAQEAAVPLNSSAGTKLFIPFDQTSGSVVYATGIALANTGASPATVTAAFMDDGGNTISTATTQIIIAAGAHTAFVLTQKFPEVNGKRGTVQFTSNVPINGLGIRYNGTAFTSISALSNVPSGHKIISHLANGGGPATGGQWSTTILLVNADQHTATYQLNFHSASDGSPLVLPLLKYGPQPSVTGSLKPGELAVIQTDGSGSTLLEGWAEVVTQDAIGGTGIFTDQAGAKRQEAAVPLNSTGGTKLVIPFDETSGSVKFATGIALANTGANPANVTAAFLDDAGNQIATATTQIIIPAGAHTAFVVIDKFPEVKGKRGTVVFASNVAIYGLGIRYNGTAFTSIGAILP